jgi:hypothetical protein
MYEADRLLFDCSRYDKGRDRKKGADASTISTDIKALKLISKQFIYDITKSGYYYRYHEAVNLDL